MPPTSSGGQVPRPFTDPRLVPGDWPHAFEHDVVLPVAAEVVLRHQPVARLLKQRVEANPSFVFGIPEGHLESKNLSRHRVASLRTFDSWF